LLWWLALVRVRPWPMLMPVRWLARGRVRRRTRQLISIRVDVQ
jgi:hypothetical protein